MKNIYVLVSFKLQSLDLKDEWKKLSDNITADMKANAKGLIFRDATLDKEGNAHCIIKWESREDQEAFKAIMDERFKNEPELMENFGKIVDLTTMKKEITEVL